MSRPEISYNVCESSTKVKTATTSDIHSVNKVIKFIKTTPSHITIPPLDLESIQIHLYSDASFNNLPDGGSQGGYIIFLCDKYRNSVPITWSSTRLKRVTRSTLAAETLALTDGCDAAFYIVNLLNDILSPKIKHKITVQAFTDNQSLYSTIKTTKLTIDRRLRVEISALREMHERGEIEVHWISKHQQLSDVLTKKGASYQSLIKVLQEGKLPLNS